MKITSALLIGSALCAGVASAQDEDSASPDRRTLEQRVERLEAELERARAELDQARGIDEASPGPAGDADSSAEAGGPIQSELEHPVTDQAVLDEVEDPIQPALEPIQIGGLTIGGAMRINYVYGDYTDSNPMGPDRGSGGGDFELDTFRLNVDYVHPSDERLTAKGEYRWYNGYNFLHTGWVGYQFTDQVQVQAGLNRVPFGVGAYGPSHNWFFDQHYYVGLADDMDLGVKAVTTDGPWSIDYAFYAAAEPNFAGASSDSARYSYDIIDNGSAHSHYRERGQVNLRAIRAFDDPDGVSHAIGGSLQASYLKADNAFADDTFGYAVSLHDKVTFENWEILGQLTYYDYNPDYNAGSGLSNDLIGMGAYDFEFPVAASGLIPSLGVAYTFDPGVDWVDTVTIYNDFSVILKDGRDAAGNQLNDSAMNVLGVAFARGGWYISVDWAFSNGNYFVGNDVFTNFGSNQDDQWQSRLNINFGYYF